MIARRAAADSHTFARAGVDLDGTGRVAVVDEIRDRGVFVGGLA